MESPSFKYCHDAILEIPSITWGLRFESEDDWQFAARRLIGKIAEFPEDVLEMTRPISGQYLHDYWGDLCEELDLVIVSLAYLGKDHTGRMFPERIAPSGDSMPDWNNLNFDLIQSAESLYDHCRDQFTRYFEVPEARQSILDDLGEKIERFAGAEHRDDICHLYYLLHLEMKFTLDVLFPHSHTWSELIFGYGRHPEHWFKLRSVDFGVLPHRMTTLDNAFTDSDRDEYIQVFLEYRKGAMHIAKGLYVGEFPDESGKPPGPPKKGLIYALLDRIRYSQDYELTAEDQGLIDDDKNFGARRSEYLKREGITPKYEDLFRSLRGDRRLSVEELCTRLQWPLAHSNIILGSFADFAQKKANKLKLESKIMIVNVPPKGDKDAVEMITLG